MIGHSPEARLKHRSLLILLLLALAIRLAWALSRPAGLLVDLPDQREYFAIARNLVDGRGLVFHDERFDDDEYAFRSPGYPAFIAGLRCSVRTVRVVQAILDTSTVLAAYLLARCWLNERQALFAALFVAVNPFLIFFSGLLLTETLFTTTLVWGFTMLARREWIGLTAFALAILIRPPAAVLVPLACAVAGGLSLRKLLTGALIGGITSIVVLFPWAYRNHRLLGEWIWTTTNAGQTQYDGFRDGADGSSNLAELPTMPELRDRTEIERNAILAAKGRQLAMADLSRSARLAVVKVGRTWSPVPLSDEYASKRNVAVGFLYSLPLFALTIACLFRRALPAYAKVLCLLPALYFTASAAATVGSLRYRIPAEPMLAVIAAAALQKKNEDGRDEG